ncbi:EamA family transporter [Azoarcus indigens]|uniref:Drug/metabolite transporter (DMT)-like permease n=1 Tax=Azoarcus indigens TaxID=29545 RepID=A0A4R6DLY2_9RHOO|nr:DMT family transporter [Azoarcus indigens]NMG67681.1 EamA family transporter [Azoarcus indigens]TDN45494.1 drug/metabolite transporter (DMT)-like permease [Azoarcus indigens]
MKPFRSGATLGHPYLLLTLTALFWAGNMVMGRAVRADVPPIALAFWRWVIALTLVLPFALPPLRTQWPLLRKAWRPVLILGAVGIGGYNTFAYVALQYTTATSATLLNSFIPVATIALAFLLLGKRLSAMEGWGVLVSLFGVLMLVSHGSLQTLLGLSLNTGDLWMLTAVLTWGLYTVGLQWRPQGVDPMLMLAAFTVVGLIVLAPVYAWELSGGRSINPSLPAIGGILYIGIFPGFLGYVFYNAGVAAVGPNRSSLFIHLMPVFATILAALFLDERPYWYHFAGIALVFVGIILTTRKPAG